MTIIICKECGKEISSKAATCPHCGLARKQGLRGAVGLAAAGCLLMIIGLFILLVASVAFLALPSSTPTTPKAEAQQPNVQAGSWNPSDPDEPSSRMQFSVRFAQKLRGFQTLAEVQKAAGSLGKITDRHLDGDDPIVSYHWDGEDPSYMLAVVRPTGWITVTILTKDSVQISFDNRGSFQCFPTNCRK